MVGLLDVAPSTQTVRVGGADVAVYGISAKGIASLFTRFPELRKAFAGKELDDSEFTPEKLIKLVPEAIAAVIAAGCGSPGDEKAEAIAERLPAGDQADLIEAILKVTMPQGAGPFVQRILALAAALNVDADSGKVQDTKSRKLSKP